MNGGTFTITNKPIEMKPGEIQLTVNKRWFAGDQDITDSTDETEVSFNLVRYATA